IWRSDSRMEAGSIRSTVHNVAIIISKALASQEEVVHVADNKTSGVPIPMARICLRIFSLLIGCPHSRAAANLLCSAANLWRHTTPVSVLRLLSLHAKLPWRRLSDRIHRHPCAQPTRRYEDCSTSDH